MAANLKKSVKLATDKATGKTRVTRVYAYDASKARKVVKSKTRRVVSPAKASARRDELVRSIMKKSRDIFHKHVAKTLDPDLAVLVDPTLKIISFQYIDATGRSPKLVRATRAV